MIKNYLSRMAYALGYIFATVCIICLIAAVVAITVRFISWLF